jgi:hypothetical protein
MPKLTTLHCIRSDLQIPSSRVTGDLVDADPVEATSGQPKFNAVALAHRTGDFDERASGLGVRETSSFMVPGARTAECYTATESYWIDLK